MFFENQLIVYPYPKESDLFPAPNGIPVSLGMAGEAFADQCLALWKLEKNRPYQFFIIREKQKIPVDVVKCVAENGMRNGDLIEIV